MGQRRQSRWLLPWHGRGCVSEMWCSVHLVRHSALPFPPIPCSLLGSVHPNWLGLSLILFPLLIAGSKMFHKEYWEGECPEPKEATVSWGCGGRGGRGLTTPVAPPIGPSPLTLRPPWSNIIFFVQLGCIFLFRIFSLRSWRDCLWIIGSGTDPSINLHVILTITLSYAICWHFSFAKFIVPEWEDKVDSARHRVVVTGLPAYVALRASTTTLCRSQLFPSSQRLCILLQMERKLLWHLIHLLYTHYPVSSRIRIRINHFGWFLGLVVPV